MPEVITIERPDPKQLLYAQYLLLGELWFRFQLDGRKDVASAIDKAMTDLCVALELAHPDLRKEGAKP